MKKKNFEVTKTIKQKTHTLKNKFLFLQQMFKSIFVFFFSFLNHKKIVFVVDKKNKQPPSLRYKGTRTLSSPFEKNSVSDF